MEQDISGVRALSRAILNETKLEAEQIVLEAQRAIASIKKQGEDEVARTRQEILAQAQSETAHFRQRSLATARLEVQRTLLTRREQLISEVFDRAAKQLEDIHQTDNYDAILRGLVAEAVERLGEPGECVVHVAQQDIPRISETFLGELARTWEGRVHLRVGDPAGISGGVILETPDGRQRYDNSFQARLVRERGHLRARVYQLLQGEA